MKRCYDCKKLLDIDEFRENPLNKDGHLGRCKSCTKKNGRERYVENRDHYNEYDRQRKKLPKRIKDNMRYHRKWRKNNPEKCKAQWRVHDAILAGKLIRQPCEICGEKALGHHEDYNKPLEVKWLCIRHHTSIDGIHYKIRRHHEKAIL